MASLTQWTWVRANPRGSEGQGSLVCCSPWGCRDMTVTELNNSNRRWRNCEDRWSVSRSPRQQVTGALLSQTVTYLISFKPHKTTIAKALSPFRRWRDCVSERLICLWSHLVSGRYWSQTRAWLFHPTTQRMSRALSAIPKEVLISVLTSGYINLPQARIFLHSSVLEKSFWCVSASALSVTTCFPLLGCLAVVKGHSTQGNGISYLH